MHTEAVVLNGPESLALRQVELTPPGEADVVVQVDYSGISTGTERLLFTGRMPPFPGMGYPLVPGYESAGHVIQARPAATLKPGDFVFVPGANCYGAVRGLFGGAARRLVTPAARVVPIPEHLGERAALLALAATARHALEASGAPDLIVGHGTLGRLVARLAVIAGGAPVVWEKEPRRRDGASGYAVADPASDKTARYRTIVDVSGDASLLDTLIGRLSPGGTVVLAGFYDRVHFAFAPAFMREARLRVAAQWQPDDLAQVAALAANGTLSLDGLITHRAPATDAVRAYRTAFSDPECLKMSLDWSACA